MSEPMDEDERNERRCGASGRVLASINGAVVTVDCPGCEDCDTEIANTVG